MHYPSAASVFVSAARRPAQRGWWAASSVALAALALATSGCVARGGVRGAVVYEPPTVQVETMPVEVQYVPEEVEAYPSYAYGGVDVYLVDGRWYRRHGDRWVVYRAEPRALASVRVGYEAKYGRNYRPQRRPKPEHRESPDRHDRR